jgi:hypothetical protein
MFIKPTLRIVNDEVKIIDCLIDRGEMLKSFDKNQYRTFFIDEDLYFVIFYADELLTQRFKMFVVEDFCVNQEAMITLLGALDEQIMNNNHKNLLQDARNKILDIFYMSKTFQALLGKDKQLEEEYFE